jgi:hypothetical protein
MKCRARKGWRREPESNRPGRICSPLHNRFAIAPVIGNPDYREQEHPEAQDDAAGAFPDTAPGMERETSLELATSTLARLRSTN